MTFAVVPCDCGSIKCRSRAVRCMCAAASACSRCRVPVVILEPVKFLGGHCDTGHVTTAAVAFCVGELLKLVLIEQLFELTHDRLM